MSLNLEQFSLKRKQVLIYKQKTHQPNIQCILLSSLGFELSLDCKYVYN